MKSNRSSHYIKQDDQTIKADEMEEKIFRPQTLPFFVPDPVKPLGGPIVSVHNLGKAYKISGRDDPVVALRDVTFSTESEFYPVHEGEFVMIRGPSGGGKTTMLNLLGTIDKPTSGVITLFGKNIDSNSTDAELSRLRLESIGFVFQTFNLLATLSAYENVELPQTVLGRYKPRQIKQRSIDLLTSVGLRDRMMHLPSELSGGEQQRVTIARALANDPKLLLLDEPTGDLDTSNTIQIMDLILDINLKKHTTCIMVTHNPDIECYADRILYMQDGTVMKQVINTRQSRLDEAKYKEYLKLKDAQQQGH
ncbi:putative ABC transporter domain protein [Monocercomonoides exilis]|uniref:putative ABC transporter domain protein n=1 Tax=Monocercomonoides exilis TaxID=2049356 RepID=UPI003559F0DF|nr:putative ABC transporter domain protein [Monocercomonoides exilis]|eukprot:MONOS_16760.1-p1 / transcript=MONOS_16760.1 / gene=MONOS_16760 / organism=Monocercomonoides_exilis_PA203 / gene_product=ABC transporter domain protein / transcript_product=ABC transporter domain protein / location=Mono_scaffold00365:16147-17426(+) / protein_length=308 / sequence_SO=supercontig / SO=protein_coding / is_pseudo=false